MQRKFIFYDYDCFVYRGSHLYMSVTSFSGCLSVRPSVHPLCTISEEPYIIQSQFLVHMCKITISAGPFFHFLKILIFGGLLGGGGSKRAKNSPKLKIRIISATHHVSGTV